METKIEAWMSQVWVKAECQDVKEEVVATITYYIVSLSKVNLSDPVWSPATLHPGPVHISWPPHTPRPVDLQSPGLVCSVLVSRPTPTSTRKYPSKHKMIWTAPPDLRTIIPTRSISCSIISILLLLESCVWSSYPYLHISISLHGSWCLGSLWTFQLDTVRTVPLYTDCTLSRTSKTV